jgi:hypothetical protein
MIFPDVVGSASSHRGLRRDQARSSWRFFPYFCGRHIRSIYFVSVSLLLLLSPGLYIKCADEDSVQKLAEKISKNQELKEPQPGIFIHLAHIFLDDDPDPEISNHLDNIEITTRKLTSHWRKFSIENGNGHSIQCIIDYIEQLSRFSRNLKYL